MARTIVTACSLLVGAGLVLLVGFRDLVPQGTALPYDPPAAPGARAVLGAGFEGGGFTLVDQRGRRVSTADDDDKLLFLTFGATDSDLTSLALGLMTRTLACLGPDAERIRPLFVSLDSAHGLDPPTVGDLAAFDSRIVALLGSAQEIRTLARRYRVRHELDESSPNRRIDHSAFLYLAGSDGHVHSYFPPSRPAAHLCEELRPHLGR